MNGKMWKHPATQKNVETLRERGADLSARRKDSLPVATKASADSGPSTELRKERIITRFEVMRFLITAGPTREPIDPVRFLSNRSSGKMGYALAEAALREGHEVCLISGPVSLSAPEKADLVSVETAAEMFEAVKSKIRNVDVAIFCAAVSDYRIKDIADQKIKKTEDELTLTLVKNPDILGSARSEFGFDGYLVGFAAETENLGENAAKRCSEKAGDLLIANDVRPF